MHIISPREMTPSRPRAGPDTPSIQRLQSAVATVARGSGFIAVSLVFRGGDVLTWPPHAVRDDGVATALAGEALASDTVVVRRVPRTEHGILGLDPSIIDCVAMPLREPGETVVIAWSNHPVTARSIRQTEELSMLLEGPARRHVDAHRGGVSRANGAAGPRPTLPLESYGSLAHELNNVVTALILDAELLYGTLDADGPAAALVRRLLESSERAASLGVLLRMASGCGGSSLDPIPLDELCGDALRRASTSLPDGVTLSYTAGHGPLRVLGDAEQLGLAIDAILHDAIAATSSDGGTVELTVDAVTLLPDAAADIGLDSDGRFIRVAVGDGGHGMDADTLRHCTRPFFTTNASSPGLGLAAARGLANSLGGALTIDSSPGEGTVVELWLPASA